MQIKWNQDIIQELIVRIWWKYLKSKNSFMKCFRTKKSRKKKKNSQRKI